MSAADVIRGLRESTGMSRRAFSVHMGIPLRTIEDWEAGRRTPPDYILKLLEFRLKYENMISSQRK